ncbi:MAG TPA: AraC family ligand binding domain-containing protein [Burkholderiaceae bacterium]|nr:AraC family ligand binding domain-containing protein [Burkholderiaceae bacterium]
MKPDATELNVFEAEARAAGFDEILDRRWPANAVLDTHTHDFDARAVVTEGEMWLTCGDTTRHLRPGDRFELAREVPHAERYGAAGAVYRVARRR